MSLILNVPARFPIIAKSTPIEFRKGWPFVILSGPNGCGKTTLLQLAMGLIPGEGKPTLIRNGEECHPSEDRSVVRYLPQIPVEALFSRMSVEDNYRLLQDVLNFEKADFADQLGLKEKGIAAWRLSVGQQKMLLLSAILCSLRTASEVDKPGFVVVFLDEPFAGLDPDRRKEVCKMLLDKAKQVSQSLEVYFVIVDHGLLKAEGEVRETAVEVSERIVFSLTECRLIGLVEYD